MKLNIFLVFCLFHRTCIKIPMIFESVHNFSHKFKHKAPLKQKEKEKQFETRRGPAKWPAGRPTQALNPPPPLSLPDADGEAPPVSCVFTAHGGSATAPAAVGEGLSPCAHAPASPHLREPIATTESCSTPFLPPRPRERWTAAMTDRGPATRAR